MPKNKGKGGKNRRRGKNESEEKREIVIKEKGQEYAQVMKMLGNGRLEAHCFDGKKRLCHIRGKMRKRVWVNQGDIVLVGLRDYQDDKGDILLKYNAEEARLLQKRGFIPSEVVVEDEVRKDGQEENLGFEFADRGVESSEDDDVGNQPSSRLKPLPDSFSDSLSEEISSDRIDLGKL
eukprot:TRINITY_DN5812_c0_g1_i1.p1 TRINITY_DN5812_c0_g1~~TRINITY_DN5812_c0_g1_i1.p1  ORF type:complete len:178 (+),score=43.46 TRINITY_DN5812_c0_g1_i1:73-606(+)